MPLNAFPCTWSGHHAVSRYDGFLLFFFDFGQLPFDGFVMVSGEVQFREQVGAPEVGLLQLGVCEARAALVS